MPPWAGEAACNPIFYMIEFCWWHCSGMLAWPLLLSWQVCVPVWLSRWFLKICERACCPSCPSASAGHSPLLSCLCFAGPFSQIRYVCSWHWLVCDHHYLCRSLLKNSCIDRPADKCNVFQLAGLLDNSKKETIIVILIKHDKRPCIRAALIFSSSFVLLYVLHACMTCHGLVLEFALSFSCIVCSAHQLPAVARLAFNMLYSRGISIIFSLFIFVHMQLQTACIYA